MRVLIMTTCLKGRISPRTFLVMLAGGLLLVLIAINLFQAAVGTRPILNWLSVDIFMIVFVPAFVWFLATCDRAYRVCYDEQQLFLRLPGFAFGRESKVAFTIGFDQVVVVEVEDAMVAPALRNILIWFDQEGRRRNFPLSPVLLGRDAMEQVLLMLDTRLPGLVGNEARALLSR